MTDIEGERVFFLPRARLGATAGETEMFAVFVESTRGDVSRVLGILC